MRIGTWNVNSVKARLPILTDWLRANSPDILLLQELKGTDFPTDVFAGLGYQSAAVTQKSYNGVAILSKQPIETTCTTLKGDEQDSHARFLEARIDGLRVVNIYLPNGNPIGTDKFIYKLAWMDRLLAEMAGWVADGVPTIVAGDFNVIPEEIDCYKPETWKRDALFQPESRERFRAMLRLGYTDAVRTLHPDEASVYTFWDYFRQNFAQNKGIRIDHLLLSPSLAGRLDSCAIDREPRAQEKPSDHTVVTVTLR